MTVSSVDNSAILSNYIKQQKETAAAATATTDSNATSISSVTGDFNTFLKILTAQLKNQDPTAPMDASEFTKQLVQYSAVEQQINTNSKLDNILTSLNPNGITPLLGYVGAYVEADSDGKLLVQGGTAKMAYTLPSEALSVDISVQDSKGKVVATIDGLTEKGLNRVAWDGSLAAGGKATDGTYKFVLTAKDSAGAVIKVDDIRVIGLVTGVETDSTGATTLKAGELSIKDTDIKSVFASVSTASTNTAT